MPGEMQSGGSAGAVGSSTGGSAGGSIGTGGAGGMPSSGGSGGSPATGGSSGGPTTPIDAGSGGSPIDAGCRPLGTVTSCGPLCQLCKAPSERTVATCNGTCAFSCRDDAPKCSDGSCSVIAWNFESGSLDGIVVRSSSGQPLAVRSFGMGNKALAVDVSQLNTLSEISFDLPICLSGSLDLQAKKLTFRVYFDGSPPSSYDFWVQSAVPIPKTGAYLDQIGAGTGVWTQYASPISKSMFASSVPTVTIQAGSLGGSFTGTIWFDDFKIQ
jgi:hypothetical protein